MEKNKRVYISGAITGLPIEEVKNNFKKASEYIVKLGFEPVNPFDIYLGKSATWKEYMLVDIPMLLTCDEIYMLSNWKQSKGATIEFLLAEGAGMKINYEEN